MAPFITIFAIILIIVYAFYSYSEKRKARESEYAQEAIAPQIEFINKEKKSVSKYKEQTVQVVPSVSPTANDEISNQKMDAFLPYKKNNELFNSKESVCNQGTESLKDFIAQFCSNKEFQKDRINLPTDVIKHWDYVTKEDLKIKAPDDDWYFASWNIIKKDYASFGGGWLYSESAFLFEFKRIDKKWYLTNYIDYFNNEY